MMQEFRAKENYERMTELMNELSLYIMFGLGFILLRYASELLFALLSALIVPFLYNSSDPDSKSGKDKHSNDKAIVASGKTTLKHFLRERGYCNLTDTVQMYNTYIKTKGMGQDETPFSVLEHMKEQDISPDIATYNTLLDISFKAERIDIALELFHHCCNIDSDVRPDVITFNIYIKGLLIRYSKGERDININTISQVLKDMAQLAIKPNEITYNTIIDLCVTIGAAKNSWDYFMEMKEKGVTPDLFTYSILVKGLKETPATNKQNFDLIFTSVEQYIKAHKGELDEILFNSLIDTAVYYKDFSKINSILEHMKEQDIKPSNVTYGILIKAFGHNGKIDSALALFDQMKKNSIEPNEVTYGCIIDSCIRASRHEEAHAFLIEMNERGMSTNIVIYTTFLKSYTKQRDFEQIWTLYERIAIKREIEPNIIFYNAMLEALVQCQRTDLLMLVYQQIHKEKTQNAAIKPDIITYSTLIKGLCKSKQMDTVLAIYEQLKSQGSQIDEVLYNSIMHGLISVGKFTECQYIHEEMVSNKILPSNITYSILIKLYTKTRQFTRAITLFDELVNDGITPGVVVNTCIIQACIKSKQIAKAIEIFEKLKKNYPEQADQVIYNTIVNGCVYAGMIQKACTYTVWSIENGITLAPDIYNNVMKNILTSKNMSVEDKKTYSKQITQYLEQNEITGDSDIMSRLHRLANVDGKAQFSRAKKRVYSYVPKKQQ